MTRQGVALPLSKAQSHLKRHQHLSSAIWTRNRLHLQFEKPGQVVLKARLAYDQNVTDPDYVRLLSSHLTVTVARL